MAKFLLAAAAVAAVADAQLYSTCSNGSQSLFTQSATLIDGTPFSFSSWTGNVTLVANVASFCGETVSHYNGFNDLIAKYGSQGLQIIGMPCNQFLYQEPGENSEILNTLKYVRPGNGYVPQFPLTEKTSVNGVLGVHPVWQLIRNACPAPTTTTSPITPSWTPISTLDVQWNFEKVLFTRSGQPYRRYSTALEPSSLEADIQELLAQ